MFHVNTYESVTTPTLYFLPVTPLLLLSYIRRLFLQHEGFEFIAYIVVHVLFPQIGLLAYSPLKAIKIAQIVFNAIRWIILIGPTSIYFLVLCARLLSIVILSGCVSHICICNVYLFNRVCDPLPPCNQRISSLCHFCFSFVFPFSDGYRN